MKSAYLTLLLVPMQSAKLVILRSHNAQIRIKVKQQAKNKQSSYNQLNSSDHELTQACIYIYCLLEHAFSQLITALLPIKTKNHKSVCIHVIIII